MSHGLFGQPDADASAFPNFSILPQLTRPMTVLLLGVDSNGPNSQRFIGTRSDTMILANVNPFTKKVSLISIPRDSRVDIARGHGVSKINSAHALGGPELAVETVSKTFSVPIDHYVVVDTEGLKKVFELVGPVQVLVEKPMQYHDHTAHLDVNLAPGLQTLDASQTEQYVRFRHDLRGDIGRIERQQWFLRQVAQKLREPQTLLKLPQLITISQEYVKTDLAPEDMAALVAFLKDIRPTQVETATLPGNATTIAGGSYWVPDMEACKLVFDRMLNQSVGENQSPDLLASAARADDDLTAGSADAIAMRIAIKYPKGAEAIAASFEQALTDAGCKVKYKWQVDTADCQHEQIVENSARTDAQHTVALKKFLPQLGNWPVNIAPDAHYAVDYTLVISPTTLPPSAPTPEAMAPSAVR